MGNEVGRLHATAMLILTYVLRRLRRAGVQHYATESNADERLYYMSSAAVFCLLLTHHR
jgi:hypothetical protein